MTDEELTQDEAHTEALSSPEESVSPECPHQEPAIEPAQPECIVPEPPADPFAELASDTVAVLMRALEAHVQSRNPAPETISQDLLRAICVTLIFAPADLGTDAPASPLLEHLRETLGDAVIHDVPEAEMCRLWLACARGDATEDIISVCVDLASVPLWEPVQSLAYRALAHFGRRNTLGTLLPSDGPLSLAQADAWLDAALASNQTPEWAHRITDSQPELLSAACRDQWKHLLEAEAIPPATGYPQASEQALERLASLAPTATPQSYEEAVTGHIAARASAALARLRLAQWANVTAPLDTNAARHLPAWERTYLRALASWQLDNRPAAEEGLLKALEQNPHQAPVRLALAALRAQDSPAEALDVLTQVEPTRDMTAARAALCARLGHPEEAGRELAAEAPESPLRYTWPAAQQESKRHETALRVALAERNGDFASARRLIESQAGAGGRHRALWLARLLSCNRRHLSSIHASQTWQRSQVEHLLRRSQFDVGQVSLTGDALFQRAAALTESEPERAAADLRNLLQLNWVHAERRAGGQRLLHTGDLLLELGHPADAVRAYELAANSPDHSADTHARLAVARVYTRIQQGDQPEELARTVEQAAALAPENPWPYLVAAVGALPFGQPALVASFVDNAEERGAPAATCRILRAVNDAASGGPRLTGEDISAAAFPPRVAAIARLLWGDGTFAERARAYMRAAGHDYQESCPLEPSVLHQALLSDAAGNGDWEEALAHANALLNSGHPLARDLAAFVRLRYGLALALRGDLDKAERILLEAEKA